MQTEVMQIVELDFQRLEYGIGRVDRVRIKYIRMR